MIIAFALEESSDVGFDCGRCFYTKTFVLLDTIQLVLDNDHHILENDEDVEQR